MIVETGQETIFYASFSNPEGQRAVLITAPVIEVFLEDRLIFKSKMFRTRDRFFHKRKINLKPGKYLARYSAIDADRMRLQGEELLEIAEKPRKLEIVEKPRNFDFSKLRKIFKVESGLIGAEIKKLEQNQEAFKKLLAKLLSTKKIEELLKNEK